MIDKNETEIMRNWAYTQPPLLSAICLAFNHEDYISQALDGMLMQETDFPFEIVINDDCSTDNTVAILKEYAEKYPSIIRLILQKENQYSKGIKIETLLIKEAVGKYIAICEGDDYWTDPHKLQIQLDEMHKVENCQMSFHSAVDVWVDKSNKDSVSTKRSNGNRLFTTREVIMGGGGFCPTASLIIEKEAVANMPQWINGPQNGDYYLQIFGSLKGGALYIDRTMSVYRRNAAGSWSSNMQDLEIRESQFEKMVPVLDAMDRHFNEQYHAEINQIKSDWYLGLAVVYLRNRCFDKFNLAIEESYRLATRKSKKLLLNYYLRKFPHQLLWINVLKNELHKYSAAKN
jgi:glycosyltransferase involved in cell wall biosynthesis